MVTTSSKKHNHLLSKLILLKQFSYSSLVFSQIRNPNLFSFNIMIRALTTTWRNFTLSLSLFHSMNSASIPPSRFTFPFVFISCSKLLALRPGQAAHSALFKSGLHADAHVRNSVLSFYFACSLPEIARKVFDEMSFRDLVSWNSLICGYNRAGMPGEAAGVFSRMGEEGFEPDETTLVGALGACRRLGDLESGRRIEFGVRERGMVVNPFLGSALIGMYSDCGDLVRARKVFDEMPDRDGVTWNAMICGYSQNGVAEEAIRLFESMVGESGVVPDRVTLAGVLSACASLGSLALGRRVEAGARIAGLVEDVHVATALVDMYGKCGCLEEAVRVFESMGERNEVSWNAMISALAVHGRAAEALSKFEHMISGRVRPNDVTFVAVLSACVHAGMVGDGLRLFESMGPRFGLAPKLEHYSCVVNMLARVGRLEEAWDFVARMPHGVDEVTLGALLGACRKSKNAAVSEKALGLLDGVGGSDSGNYVVSSKIYADLRRWDECADTRRLMKVRGIVKTPGRSRIELRGTLHEFRAGDRIHPDSNRIRRIIRLINAELEKEGYRPDIHLH